MKSKTAALILAAGEGRRMKSKLPKVLHPCGERPLVAHAVALALERRCSPIVVVVDPRGGTRVREVLTASFPDAPLEFATQPKPRGTGDAVRHGLDAIAGFKGRVLILYGDVPLLQKGTVGRLERALQRSSLAFLTAEVDDPSGYGRVVREGGKAARIVEHRDASAAERAIREINAGVYLISADLLRNTLKGLGSDNAQGEVYLTDAVEVAAGKKGAAAVLVKDANEIRGVNNRAALAVAEAILRRRLVAHHQARGVTFLDPDHTFLGVGVRLGQDAIIGVGVQLLGQVKVGAGARIDGPTVVRNAEIGAGAHVHSFSHIEGARVGPSASVGPFGRLRTGARLDEGAKVGNFVELKKTRLGKGAKANHLAYLGDADVGPGANVGAGTITCNYDGGPIKHKTKLGKNAFTGSNSTIVAPINIGDGAYIAAGSTVTKDVGKDGLAFGRARQVTRKGYAKKLRERIQDRKKD